MRVTTPLRLAVLLILCGCRGAPSRVLDGGPVPDHVAPDLVVADSRNADSRAGLLRAFYAEARRYLTDEDPGDALLDRMSTVYRDIPLDVVVDAVTRQSRASLPAAGVHQHQWVNPFYKSSATYHAYVPPELALSPAPAFPLLVFLHGAGGDGDGTIASTALQDAARRLGAILVAPTSSPGCDWNAYEDYMAQVVLLVQHLKRRYPIDDSRVVLTGFSMGGRGSFSVGVAYPDPYCGVVPVAGSIGAVHNTSDLAVHKAYCCPHVENLTNLRLHYISGDQDMALMLYQNRACALCLAEQGSEYVYTELAGQGHVFPPDLWEQAVAWTLARPRAPYPTRVIYNLARQASAVVPEDIFMQQKLRVPQYWADIERRHDDALPARLEAWRAGNTITVKSTNVAQVGLYLAPGMVDLQSVVRVLHESRGVLFSGVLTPDRQFLLAEARRRADRAMAFTNHLTLAVEK